MEKPPPYFKAARIFILISAAIWLAFAGITAAGAHPSYAGSDPLRLIMSSLALIVCLALLALYYLLGRRNRPAYILGIAFLIIIFLLTVADQIGWVDAAVLILTITPVVLLLLSRRWYFQPTP